MSDNKRFFAKSCRILNGSVCNIEHLLFFFLPLNPPFYMLSLKYFSPFVHRVINAKLLEDVVTELSVFIHELQFYFVKQCKNLEINISFHFCCCCCVIFLSVFQVNQQMSFSWYWKHNLQLKNGLRIYAKLAKIMA